MFVDRRMDKEVALHIHNGILQISLQCAFDRFVHSNPQLESFVFFFNQEIIISCSLVSVCGTTCSLMLKQAA